jgi:hypothetical protein
LCEVVAISVMYLLLTKGSQCHDTLDSIKEVSARRKSQHGTKS